MAKKKIDEALAGQPEPIQPPRGPDASPGQATLHPNSQGSMNDDPKTKFETIVAAIGAMAAMRDDDKFAELWNGVIAKAEEIGHGMGISGDQSKETNQGSISMHASGAVGKAMKEDLQKVFDGEASLSEDFKTKAATLFEAAIEARMILESLRIQEESEKKLAEEVQKITEELESTMTEYLDFATETWMTQNEVAIESSLRNEIAGDLLEGLKQLLADNNVTVPEEQVDVVEAMSEKIDELERALADKIAENADLTTQVEGKTKDETIKQVSEGLTLIESEKLKELAENIEYTNPGEFKTKLETIKASNFVKDPKKSMISEDLEEVNEDNQAPAEKPLSNPEMKYLVEALQRMAPARK